MHETLTLYHFNFLFFRLLLMYRNDCSGFGRNKAGDITMYRIWRFNLIFE